MPFLFNLLISFLLASLLSYVYIKYGHSLSNRKSFSKNFTVLTMTTMLIITIVKSSLALSLGLVGALSIVRFRTALKEPEELSFTFLSIAIGLGLGANQLLVTVLGVGFIIFIIIAKSKLFRVEPSQHLHLVISSNQPKEIDFDKVVEILKKYCGVINLKRLSEDDKHLESAISIEVKDYNQLMSIKATLKKEVPFLALNFVDNSGIINS